MGMSLRAVTGWKIIIIIIIKINLKRFQMYN